MSAFQSWGATLQFIVACFAIFIVVWIIAAFRTKRTVRRGNRAWRFVILVAVVADMLLRRAGFHWLAGPPLWSHTLGIGLLADALALCGLAITLWARFTLGGNWSGGVVLKEQHELIERGPYQYVRHPIYTGILLMALGLAIELAQTGGFFVLAVLVIGFWLKSRQEERLLTTHFAQEYPAYRRRVKALIPFVF